jgi:hypothetical protein
MEEKDAFREALGNFTFDVASGGAIAHLADLGYTPQEIQKRLDFPTPYERVREAYLKWLLDRKIIVEEKQEFGRKQERAHFVTEYDAYGHKSFRRVVEQGEGSAPVSDPEEFADVGFDQNVFGSFALFLKEYCCGEARNAYVSCDFGLRAGRAPEAYEAFLRPLKEEQRLYMEGVRWERKEVWHVLDERMRGILATLYEQSSYHGTILVFDKKERIHF